jgi:DNA-binding CsgD family transcriptional regulator
MGILTFTVVVTGWSLAIGLAITLIGLPIALLTVALSRAMAAVERRRAQLVLGAPLEARYRSWTQGSVWKRLRSVFADPTTWKDLAWHLLLLLPVGIAGFAIAVTTWSTTAGLLLMPAWWWIGHDGWAVDLGLFSIDGWPEAFAGTGIGLLSVPLTIALVRGSAAGTGGLARAVLGPGTRALEERVETLTATRAGAARAGARDAPGAHRRARAGRGCEGPRRAVAAAGDVDAVRRVAGGGTALDPEAVAQVMGGRSADGPLADLTPRKCEVLGLMAEGRSNAAIARELVVTAGAVEKHISSIFGKLRLPPSDADHRRVLAVLAWLREG